MSKSTNDYNDLPILSTCDKLNVIHQIIALDLHLHRPRNLHHSWRHSFCNSSYNML